MSDVGGEVEVTRNEDEDRWEARIGGELAGFAAYHLTDELIVFTHTEVEPEFEGRGVAGALARTALDEVAARGDPQGDAAVPVHQGVDPASPRLHGARLRGVDGVVGGLRARAHCVRVRPLAFGVNGCCAVGLGPSGRGLSVVAVYCSR